MQERLDSDLVAATLARDRAAFGTLIDRHRPRTVAVARRLLRDPVEAEDVVQEALLQAFLALGALREPARFGAWLAGIAANLAKMRLRAPARRMLSLEDLTGGRRVPRQLLAAPDPSPEQAAEARELLGLVRAAIDLLPEGQRAVVLLHYLDGLSCQEIAALLGRSTGAVRVRLHRARAELRERLGAAHPASETHRAAVPPRSKEERVIEVTPDDVVVRSLPDGDLTGKHRIVLLRERDGDRIVPIWVGAPEGDALALQLGGAETPRPLTFDLAVRMLELSDARIERVAISSLRDNTFYGVVTLRAGERVHEVDARPSDALNLAVRVGAPVVVEPGVMEQAGVPAADVFPRIEEEGEKLGLEKEEGEWRSLTPELVMASWPRPPARPAK
jgi:RNA polymerase sigma factor (sigma-70 family)